MAKLTNVQVENLVKTFRQVFEDRDDYVKILLLIGEMQKAYLLSEDTQNLSKEQRAEISFLLADLNNILKSPFL